MFTFIIFKYVHVFVWGCVYIGVGNQGGQRQQIPPELEL